MTMAPEERTALGNPSVPVPGWEYGDDGAALNGSTSGDEEVPRRKGRLRRRWKSLLVLLVVVLLLAGGRSAVIVMDVTLIHTPKQVLQLSIPAFLSLVKPTYHISSPNKHPCPIEKAATTTLDSSWSHGLRQI